MRDTAFTEENQSLPSWVMELCYTVGQKWDHDRARRKELVIYFWLLLRFFPTVPLNILNIFFFNLATADVRDHLAISGISFSEEDSCLRPGFFLGISLNFLLFLTKERHF